MRRLRHILLVLILLAAGVEASAQFKEDAFHQNYDTGQDTTAQDTSKHLFSFKEYFGGLAHKRQARIGTLFGGSTIIIGGMQIYNKDYWKLPIIYGGIGTGIGLGVYYGQRYKATGDQKFRTGSIIAYSGAALFWWASLMDGTASYKSSRKPHPGKSTLYSILLPGLGQMYNGEYWKVPIYWGALMGSTYFLVNNHTNYIRYKRIHNEATSPDVPYTGPISAETALYYRNVFRRYRDYSIVALVGFYLLQVIDANVFAYMQDFELSDDLSVHIEPKIYSPLEAYAYSGATSAVSVPAFSAGGPSPGVGLSIGLRF